MDESRPADLETPLTVTQLRALVDVYRLLLQVANAPNPGISDAAIPPDGQPGLPGRSSEDGEDGEDKDQHF